MIILAILLTVPMLAACGGGGDDNGTGDDVGNGDGNGDIEKKDVTITIGELIDMTGVASTAMHVIHLALEDVVEYYNDGNLIPGVKLKIETYDEQYDPAKDIPGYEWLKGQGADFIWTPVPPAVDTLQPTLNRDKFLMFAATANLPQEELAGGYVFSLGITPEYEALTLVKWIAENDWDWETKGPAKIGGAAWSDGYSDVWLGAAEAYANAHPDQFEWAGGHLAPLGTFIWDTEIAALTDVDYAYMPVPPPVFVREYRKTGGTAKLIGTDVHAAFLGMMHRGDLWDEFDETLFVRSSRWYNEQGPIVDLYNASLDAKGPEKAQSIRQEGCGYIAYKQIYLMLDIVRQAVETVGPENFSTQALYDAATSWSFSVDGIDDFNSFDESKRISQNYYAIYEATAADMDLHRRHDEWLPQVVTP